MKQADAATSGTTGSSDTDPLAVLVHLGERLAEVADDLRPECVPGHRVRDITRALTDIERRARGLRLVLRRAAADTGDWKAKGHRSAADQVAKEEGISTGQASREIEASGRLARLPAARDAAGRGEISPEAAAVVAEGATADPSSESSLVRSARRGDLQATRRRAQDVIAKADERSGERARRIYQRRGLRTWVTVDGEGHGHWNVPPEMHARFMAALAPYREAAFRASRAAGDRLTADQLMADALDMLMRDVLLDQEAGDPQEGGSDGSGARRPASDPAASSSGSDDGGHGPDASGPVSDPVASASGSDDASPSLFDAPAADDEPSAPDPATPGDGPTGVGDPGGADRPGTTGRPRRPGGPAAHGAIGEPSVAGATGGPVDATPTRAPTTTSSTDSAGRGGRPARGGGPSAPPRRHRRAPAQVHVLVDLDALRRGYAADGETCEIHGLGTIPVALARHLLQDSMLRLIVTGTDVTAVSSHRRYVPEAVRRALFARDKGRCVVCGSDRFLELHHFGTDFAAGGATEYANLAHVCSREHALITHCGWSLHQTDDGWDFRPPGGAEGRDPP